MPDSGNGQSVSPWFSKRMMRIGFRNISFALRPGVLFSIAARARYPLAASIATQLAILLSSVVLARAMGKHVFGQYGMILTIQVIFFTASNLRLSSILPAFIAPLRDRPEDINRISATAALLTLALSGAAVLAFFALLPASTALCEIPGLETAAALICIPLVATLPMQYVVLAEIQSMEQIGLWAVASAFVGITPVASVLLGSAWFSRLGMGGFAVFAAVGNVAAIFPLVFLRRRAGLPLLRPVLDVAVGKRLLLGGVLLWFICVLDTAALSYARVFTVRCADHGEAACFILAYGFVGYLQMVNGAFSVPLVPKWSRLARARRRSKLLRDLRNAVAALLLVGGGYGAALVLLAPYLVPLIYGAEFAPAIRLIRILAATCPIIGVGFAAWSLSISQGRVRVVFWANVGWASVLALASWFLIPAHGAAGAAVAVVIAYASWGAIYTAYMIAHALEIASWPIRDADEGR